MTTGLAVRPPSFRGYAGVARRDMTPPFGIHAAIYGAAALGPSTGSHRSLLATALAVRSDPEGSPVVLVAIDHVEIGDLISDIAGWVVDALASDAPVDRARVMVACSHTHASPSLADHVHSRPGGHLFEAYARQMREAISEAAREAVASTVAATITWGTGRCDLAVNRDLPNPKADPTEETYVCGYNPGVVADDTLLVGRVTADADDATMATLINYACHATSLGWGNTLVSPDFVGGLREIVEGHTEGAPNLFLQGASGDLSPAHQYSAEPTVADRHGRRLGFASMAVLAGMLDPGHELAMDEVVESGAALAPWSPRPFEPDRALAVEEIVPVLPLKELPTIAELDAAIASTEEGWQLARLLRKKAMAEILGSARSHPTPAWVWRLGTSVLVGHPNEAYSDLQIALRAAYPDLAVVVMNLVNDSDVVAYLSPQELADLDLYQVWQSPFDAGSLEILTDACRDAIGGLVAGTA